MAESEEDEVVHSEDDDVDTEDDSAAAQLRKQLAKKDEQLRIFAKKLKNERKRVDTLEGQLEQAAEIKEELEGKRDELFEELEALADKLKEEFAATKDEQIHIVKRQMRGKIDAEKSRVKELTKKIKAIETEGQVGLATAVVDFMNETVMENDICCCFKDWVHDKIHDDVEEEHEMRMLIPRGVDPDSPEVEELHEKVQQSHAVFPFVRLLTLVTVFIAYTMVDIEDHATTFSFTSTPKKAWLVINGFCFLMFTGMKCKCFSWCMAHPADPDVAEALIACATKAESDEQFRKMRWYSNCQQWLYGLFSSQFILYLWFWVKTQSTAGELAEQDWIVFGSSLKFMGHTVKSAEGAWPGLVLVVLRRPESKRRA
jgi:hypothetical protein